jgi:hypothetical protein
MKQMIERHREWNGSNQPAGREENFITDIDTNQVISASRRPGMDFQRP